MLPNLMRSIARGGRSFVSRRNFSSSRGQVIYQDMDAALEQKQQAAASMELKEQEDDS
ncbi:unnamed protein product [Thlaspi arvense]|uniref:Uncharacterized protein n=1 Tax=Thlaspi arvense TaxID=13288 RepID=A0AAU9RWY1_THLAR|nr:unnamed protein product [Thlaspi arvense]